MATYTDSSGNIWTYSGTAISDWEIGTGTYAVSVPVDNGAGTTFTDFGIALQGKAITSCVVPGNYSAIAVQAFYQCASMTACTLQSGVTTIGESAFLECTAMTSISLPNTLTTIGDNGLRNTGLTSLVIPDSVTTMMVSYGYACCENPNLTTVHIGTGMTEVSRSAFQTCPLLTTVTGMANVTVLAEGCLSTCDTLTHFTIPSGVTAIEASAFYMSGLTSIVIPNSVTSIGDGAFYNTPLTSITIGTGVTTLGSSVFADCASLRSISIPDGVTTFGNTVFGGCTGLESVSIGSGLGAIGNYTFSECIALTTIAISPSNATYTSVDGVMYNHALTTMIAYPGGKPLPLVLPNTVTTIGAGAFYNNTALTTITIPDSVTTLGVRVFSGCSALTSAVIGSGVTTIGDFLFEHDSALVSISFLGLYKPTSVGASWTHGISGSARGHAIMGSDFPIGVNFYSLLMGVPYTPLTYSLIRRPPARTHSLTRTRTLSVTSVAVTSTAQELVPASDDSRRLVIYNDGPGYLLLANDVADLGINKPLIDPWTYASITYRDYCTDDGAQGLVIETFGNAVYGVAVGNNSTVRIAKEF